MLLVRERPPLSLSASITTPDGHVYRWAPDEHKGENVSSGMSFGSTMPGGFDQATVRLARKPTVAYSDLVRLSNVTITGVGGRVAWEGRIDTVPSSSGDQSAITPGLTGWQAHLDDDKTAREIYVDCSLTNWQGMSVQRQINFLNSSADPLSGSAASDLTTGAPALVETLTGAWVRSQYSENWYDSQGIPLGILLYNWKAPLISPGGDPNWSWSAYLSVDDVASAYDSTGTLTASSSMGGLVPSVVPKYFGLIQFAYGAAGGVDGTQYTLYWTGMGVYGTHGLPLQGVQTATTVPGVLSSDVEAHAIRTWAPKLKYTTGANGTIQASSFVLPQLVFMAPGTASTIVKAATAFEMRDWAVWEGPTYWSNDYGKVAKLWRARSGPTKLQQTGPTVARLFNGVIVGYSDVTGVARTVGPPGTRVNITDPSLLDSDPQNPANLAGINRYGMLTLGTSTPARAITTGAIFLQYQHLTENSGQASIVGHIQDGSGNWWPAWAIRAGDAITFTDAADPDPRRVVSVSYDDASKTAQLQLDAPPDGMTALLQRLGISIAERGLA